MGFNDSRVKFGDHLKRLILGGACQVCIGHYAAGCIISCHDEAHHISSTDGDGESSNQRVIHSKSTRVGLMIGGCFSRPLHANTAFHDHSFSRAID